MYFYKANALGVGGRITRPWQGVIESQAATSLAITGGHGFSRVGKFRIDGFLSFDAAYSEVAGSFDECHNVYTTYAHSAIEKLNIADMVTADRLVCRTAVYAPGPGGNPAELSFDITGSYFDNLKIAGHNIDITLATHVFHEHDTYSKIAKAYQGGKFDEWMVGSQLRFLESSELEAVEEAYAGLRGMSHLVKEYRTTIRSSDRESYWLSAANHLDLAKQIGASEILNFGSVICIPKFGCIFLAELQVESSFRRLNMLRVEFGSTQDGSLVAGCSEAGGRNSFSESRYRQPPRPPVDHDDLAPQKEGRPKERRELNAIASQLAADAEEELLRAQSVKAEWSALDSQDHDLEKAIQEVGEVIDAISPPHSLTDKASLLPVADLVASSKARIDRARLRLLKRIPRPTGPALEQEQRVVNLSFLGTQGVVRPDETLQANRRYNLRVQVGSRLAETIVQNPRQIPEDQLRQFMKPEGLPLRVVVSSRDFELIDQELMMSLPPAGPSQMIQFRLRTPVQPGNAQLRVVIYFKGNALQSLLVTAGISIVVLKRHAVGNKAEVEYCLCGTMNRVEMYPERTLNILTNESADGTHTFSVSGTDINEHFTFTEGQMNNALKSARLTLLKACFKLDSSERPTDYLYNDSTNAGARDKFVADLKELAAAGSDLYVGFVTQRNPAFRKRLRTALKKSASIQITAVKSAKYVFPWALVYDKTLELNGRTQVCDLFLRQLKNVEKIFPDKSNLDQIWASMDSQYCLTVGCPHDDDPEVICPSGFWGFRHLIEQPPSITDTDEKGVPARDTELLLEIKDKPVMVMGISLNLQYPDAHHKQIKSLERYNVALKRDKKTIFDEMSNTPPPNVVYFYCHGGKDERKKAFLGVGDRQRITPNDLVTYEIDWTESHPLVFINGCHTAELTPDDLLTFVNTFIWCQASGVIGTEISIPESLAREFALEFFRALGDREASSVGKAIRRVRLLLLSKYNPLGLAYTPYCHGSLQFNFPAHP